MGGVDLSKLSDSDLEALSKGDVKNISTEGLQYLHDQTAPEPSSALGDFGKGALKSAAYLASIPDKLLMAPVRSAIGAAQTGGSPLAAFASQYVPGGPEAPSGKTLVENAGVPSKTMQELGYNPEPRDYTEIDPSLPVSPEFASQVSPSQILGLGVDLTAGIPLAGMGASKLLSIIPGASKVGDVLKTGASKLSSQFSGIPAKALETYANRGAEVKNLVNEFGGELPTAADSMKEKVVQSIKDTKQGLSDQITQELANPQNAAVRYSPVDVGFTKSGKQQSVMTPVSPNIVKNGPQQALYSPVESTVQYGKPSAGSVSIGGEPEPVKTLMRHLGKNGEPLSESVQFQFGKNSPVEQIPYTMQSVERGFSKSGEPVKFQPTTTEISRSGPDVKYQPIQPSVSGSGPIRPEISPGKPAVDVKPIISKLETVRDSLNPHYNPGDISQINEMIEKIKANADNGHMDLQSLFETRNFLQTRAQSNFVQNGQLFVNGDKSAKAANDARKLATHLLHEQSPKIAHVDSIYSDLHDLDDKISASLLGQGKPEGVFASAGGGTKNVHQLNLQRLGEITGTNPVSDAELLYSAKNMKPNPNGPDIIPTLLRTGLDTRSFINKHKTPLVEAATGSRALEDILNSLVVPQRAPAINAMERRQK